LSTLFTGQYFRWRPAREDFFKSGQELIKQVFHDNKEEEISVGIQWSTSQMNSGTTGVHAEKIKVTP
jgi:hypothetical protein